MRSVLALAVILTFPTLAEKPAAIEPQAAKHSSIDTTSDKLAAKTDFDLPAQPLGTALRQFADQAGIQILFEEEVVAGLRAPAIKALDSAIQVLNTLLNNTNLEYAAKDQTIAVRRKISVSPAPAYLDTTWNSGTNAIRIAQRDEGFTNAASPGTSAVGDTPISEADSSNEGQSKLEEVVVTGSRIERNGFVTATPTTVIDQNLINSSAASGIAGVLQSMPAFKADYSASNTAQRASRTPGGAFANLRSLGSPRTLTLIDGKRNVPTSFTDGTFDLNLVPGILIDHVDVVTGGASAVYGSDAVAGVVNILLKHDLQGVIGDISGGMSSHSDNKDVHIGLAAGRDFGPVHFTVAGEYDDNKGVGNPYTRDWGREEWGVMANPAVTAANPKSPTNPANLLVRNYHPANVDVGGVIVSGTQRGTTFLDNGGTGTFAYGSPVGASFMSGGQNAELQYISSSLLAPLRRYNLLVRADSDVNNFFSVWGEAAYANSHVIDRGAAPRFTTPLTINRDNAYLPASVAAQIPVGGTISVGKWALDAGLSETNSESQLLRFSTGMKGQLGAGWTWDAYAQYAKTDYRGEINNVLYYPNFLASIDAVRNSAGEIVCRSTLTNPTNGCVPTSIFGPNAINDAAKAYFMGNSWFAETYTQDVVAVNVRGDVFSTWAGLVSLALGAEHRNDKLSSTADPRTVACNQASPFTGCFYLNNLKPVSGSNNVTEGYIEAVTPLLKDQPFAQLLELDTAARQTHYSTSGDVTTWKAGLNYAVNDSVRFRGTRSRDIRAPTLNDLFSPGVGPGMTILNPATSASVTVPNIQTGNPDLKPEEADTTTFGVVVSPSFLPGLSFSIDYYRINMNDAIVAASGQAIVNGCFAGITSLCQYVSLSNGGVATSGASLATSSITSIQRRTLNISTLSTEGYDFELRYTTPLDRLFGSAPGDLTLALYTTYVAHVLVNDGTALVNIDRAGEVGDAGLGTYGVPKLRGRIMATYANGPLSVTGTVRYIDGGVYNATYTAAEINDNTVNSQTLFDLSGQFDLMDRKLQLYGAVQNVFDADPPADPTLVQPTNPAFYDTIGRTFKLGVRFAF